MVKTSLKTSSHYKHTKAKAVLTAGQTHDTTWPQSYSENWGMGSTSIVSAKGRWSSSSSFFEWGVVLKAPHTHFYSKNCNPRCPSLWKTVRLFDLLGRVCLPCKLFHSPLRLQVSGLLDRFQRHPLFVVKPTKRWSNQNPKTQVPKYLHMISNRTSTVNWYFSVFLISLETKQHLRHPGRRKKGKREGKKERTEAMKYRK